MIYSKALAAALLVVPNDAFPTGPDSLGLVFERAAETVVSFIGYGLGDVAIKAKGTASGKTWNGYPNGGTGDPSEDRRQVQKFSNENIGFIPRGVNPPSCKPKEGELPIVLIPGTGEQAYDNWAYMGPKLADEGYCVYSFNHNPVSGPFGYMRVNHFPFYGNIKDSADALRVFVDLVRNQTGSDMVDLVGHSQGGGALPYYYLKNLVKDDPPVRKLIGITPSLGTRGKGLNNCIREATDWKLVQFLLDALLWVGNSNGLTQQLYSSPFMKELHETRLTNPKVEYVNIATKTDQVLLPWSRCIVNETQVTNYVLQDLCPHDYSNHTYVSYSANVYTVVLNQLKGFSFTNITCEAPPADARERPEYYDETGAFTKDDY